MKQITSLLLVFMCISSAFCQLTFNYQASSNVSANINNNGWQYRTINFNTWSISEWMGTNYLSISANGAVGNSNANLLLGSAYINLLSPPFAWVSYFESAANWNLLANAGQSFATSLGVSASGGYVGTSYLYLVEKNSAGTEVARQSLTGTLLSTQNGLNYDSVPASTSTGGNLQYVTYSGSRTNGVSVSFTFLASSVAGILDQADTVVGPKSLETVLQIQNYPYQAATNTLTLVIGVGTGSGQSNGDNTLISGSGSSQVYFYTSKNVVVDGKNGQVDISFSSNTTLSDNTNFKAQLNAKYAGSSTYQLVSVTFPAGANNIIYDPAVGTGEPIQAKSSASKILLSFGGVVLILVSLLF